MPVPGQGRPVRLPASMKVPPKRKGNTAPRLRYRGASCLNESPSEKEGKFKGTITYAVIWAVGLNESPSEKEGKFIGVLVTAGAMARLNESPSEKEGKSLPTSSKLRHSASLNESPSEKEGKYRDARLVRVRFEKLASMKVPPKRKGNLIKTHGRALNARAASMKVPPKRKGNLRRCSWCRCRVLASMKVPPKRKGNAIWF